MYCEISPPPPPPVTYSRIYASIVCCLLLMDDTFFWKLTGRFASHFSETSCLAFRIRKVNCEKQQLTNGKRMQGYFQWLSLVHKSVKKTNEVNQSVIISLIHQAYSIKSLVVSIHSMTDATRRYFPPHKRNTDFLKTNFVAISQKNCWKLRGASV